MPKARRKASRLQPNKEVSVMAWIEDAAIVLRKGISETDHFRTVPDCCSSLAPVAEVLENQ
jgi:hypothetical protein